MKLCKDERAIEVRTALQASAFLGSGWIVADETRNADSDGDKVASDTEIAKEASDTEIAKEASDTEIAKEATKRGRPAKTV